MFNKTKLLSKIALTMAIFMLFSVIAFAENGEVQKTTQQQQFSEWVTKGWSRIYKDGTFDSTKILNRGEFVALINSLLNFKDKEEPNFKDVASDSPYFNEISKAVKAGYIKGKGNGIFDPDAEISRAEAHVMIVRAFKLGMGKEVKAVLEFKDYSEVPNWAVGAVETLAEKGYINDKNKVKPQEKLLSSEAIALLEKINSDNKASETKPEEVKGGGNNPLNFIEAYITTVNEDKSVDLYKLENTVDINKDGIIKLAFDRGIVREYWDNNQKQIVLKSPGGREILSEVFRIEGADSEKSFIFIKIGEELKSGKDYNIIIGKDLKANNGNTLGNEVTITFTVK